MIELKINDDKYIIKDIKDIYKYDYKNIITLKIVKYYNKFELPKELDKLEELYIEDCINDIKIPEYKKLRKLYLENIKYNEIYELPKFKNLIILIIKCCKRLIIPDYENLEYLYIDKYIIDDNNIYEYNRKYNDLFYCILKEIKNIKEINFDSPKMRLLVNYNNDLKVNIKKSDNYYTEINNKNINKIINKVFDENIDFIIMFKKRFNEILEQHMNDGKFTKEYFEEVIFKEFFNKYNDYNEEDIYMFKTIIYENIDEYIINHNFNETVLGFKTSYIACESFVNNYGLALSCCNFNYINEIKKDILNFINTTDTKYSLNDNDIIKTKKIKLN